MVTEICNLSEKWVDLSWEYGSETSWASSDKHLLKLKDVIFVNDIKVFLK